MNESNDVSETTPADSVLGLIQRIQGGDEDATKKLWGRYFDRLLQVIRRRLQRQRLYTDEEDIALSVFKTLFAGLQAGKLTDFEDRDSLWGFLIHLSYRKVSAAVRYSRAARRNVNRTLREGSLHEMELVSLAQEPPVELLDTIEEVFESLPNPMLRNVALAKLQGYSNSEISDMFSVSERTIERKLRLIRLLWDERDSNRD